MITAKKVKRKCNVRGCRNTASYSISHYREGGNTVIICKDCLKEALNVIEGPKNKELEMMENGNPEMPADDKASKPDGLICPKCGRVYKNGPAYKKHMEQCGG